jgi:hypothetical protein
MTASAANSIPDDPLEFDQLEVWPDEIRIGDIYGGYVVTAIAQADHYRAPAVRLTIFTDPESLPEDVRSEEFGRFVLMTDRHKGHKVPIDRPVRR